MTNDLLKFGIDLELVPRPIKTSAVFSQDQ